MWLRSFFPDRPSALALAMTALLPAIVAAQPFPVLDGDPVDPSVGRAYQILPGVPLILPQANGKFDPPIVVSGTIGDVDLVIRAGSPAVGPSMPAPAEVPPVAIAGGTRVVDGSEVPFTVIVSDGSAGLGVPLLGPQMDGLPVIVFAFADLDGDGFVGPTAADSAGLLDDTRERQESDFVVGRTAAVFVNGVATGSVAVWRGAPASSGGLDVVLVAAAYVGPFSPQFMLGNVPDGPAVSTMLPFFPRFDPTRVVDAKGQGGPAGPDVRLGVSLEAAFDPPVGDAELGTPFALPTDGSSPTIDRAVVQSGAMSRARFVRPSVAAGFPTGTEMALLPGAAGTLWEPLDHASLPDDGPGNPVVARLVPVDLFDNVTDPPAGATVTLVAGAGVRIASPDSDGDPAVETVALASAAGVDVVLDDTGTAADGPGSSMLTVLRDGLPVDELALTLTIGGGGTTTTSTTTTVATGSTASSTTTTAASGSTTSITSPSGGRPVVDAVGMTGAGSIASGCDAHRTLYAVVTDVDGDLATVTASIAIDGGAPVTIALAPGVASDPAIAAGAFAGALDVAATGPGTAAVTIAATDAAGHVAVPRTMLIPIASGIAPFAGPPDVAPTTIPAGAKTLLSVHARASDDCGVKRVLVALDRGKGFRKFLRLRDDGRHGDGAAGDGLYGGTKRVKLPAGTIALRTAVRGKRRLDATSAPTTVQVGP